MKQTATEWLAEKYNYVTWLRNRDEVSAEQGDRLRKLYLAEAKKREESNLLRYGFKCFWLGVLASIIGTLLAKFI